MKTLILLLVFVALIPLTGSLQAQGNNSLRWPPQAGPDDASIRIPAAFTIIPSLARTPVEPLLNVRVRSSEGSVEFALAAISARGLPNTVEARALALPLAPGERIVSRSPSTRALRGETGDYVHFNEDITVEGPGGAYTRYFRRELSTSNLPGASSVLWEFKVTGDKARKSHQEAYRQFKKSHTLGEF